MGACLAVSCVAAPLDAYGRLPAIEAPALSPDGASLALIVTNGEQRKVAIRDLASGVTSVLDSSGVKVRDLQWAGPGHLLIVTSLTGGANNLSIQRGEYGRVYDYDLAQRKMRPLLSDVHLVVNAVFDPPMPRQVEGRPVVYLTGLVEEAEKVHMALLRVGLDQGHTRWEHEGFPDTRDWLVGVDGQPLAMTDFSPVSRRWALKVMRRGAFVTVREEVDPADMPVVVGLGRDGRSVLVRTLEDGAWAYREISSDAPAWGEPLAWGLGAEPILEPGSRRLIGVSSLENGVRRAHLEAAQDQAIWNAVAAAYPGDRVKVISWSDDHRKLVAWVDSPTTGPAYALVDLASKRSSWIGDAYPELKAADLSPVRPFRATARDGLALDGDLTVPAGRAEKDLKLVVLVHPGPARHDEAGFDWWVQGLASRGYAVLRLNYRGSEGLGAPLRRAGDGQWGRSMQTDLSDAVGELANQGVVDPQGVCIMGEDYGGYAALAGVTLQQGVYRCAVAVGGISDPGRFLAWSRTSGFNGALRRWSTYLAATDPDAASLKAISPLAQAAKASAPILLVHGTDDVVSPPAQSASMAQALQADGKPVEVVTLPGEDHWLTNGATRKQALSAVAAFLERNNPPR